MPTFYTFAVDEHGIGYSPETFYTIEDVVNFLEMLRDSLEDASPSASYSLRQTILDLEDQLLNFQQSAD
jgi:hypothetical protein